MTKSEFIAALRAKLGFMPEDEICITLDYYAERIDALILGGMDEGEAVKQAGEPEEIAERLKRERSADTNAADNAAGQAGDAGAAVPAVQRSSTSGKRPRIIALAALAAAAAVVTLGRVLLGIFSQGEPATRTFEINELFDIVEINTSSVPVELLPTDGDAALVEYIGYDDVEVTGEVRGNVLYASVDNGTVLPLRLSVGPADEKLNIYLPEREYDAVHAMTSSGKITARAVSAVKLKLDSTSGSIRLTEADCGELALNSTSGGIHAEGVNIEDEAAVTATSGSLHLTDITCGEFAAETSSGSIHIKNGIADEAMTVKSSSGSVELNACDAGRLNISTTSGSVRGTLLTPKAFDADSVSGSVDVPGNTAGGECRISTTSGSIRMEIK